MANNAKTIKHRTEKTTIDKQTGEVLSEETTTTYRFAQEPAFVKVYTEAMTELGLKSHHATMVHHLGHKMEYDNMLYLTPGMRVRMSEAMGIQVNTFNNYLNALLGLDVLRRIGHGEFMVNPTLVAKGKFEEIQPRFKKYYQIKQVKTQKGRAPKPKEEAETVAE